VRPGTHPLVNPPARLRIERVRDHEHQIVPGPEAYAQACHGLDEWNDLEVGLHLLQVANADGSIRKALASSARLSSAPTPLWDMYASSARVPDP
jgi:hypothetical protein